MAIDSSTEMDAYSAASDELQYRALSTGAVISLVLGVLSIVAIPTARETIAAFLFVVPVPAAGLVVGLLALRKIRGNPEELTGGRLAGGGALLSAGFLVGGFCLAIYTYANEVPDGYERISFSRMRPDDREKARHVVVPKEILELSGKKVFIKGYMRPGSQRVQLDEFLLVRDNNQCCFGDLSKVKYYDQMVVQFVPPLRADYSTRMFRVGGTLSVDPTALTAYSSRPIFLLKADYAR